MSLTSYRAAPPRVMALARRRRRVRGYRPSARTCPPPEIASPNRCIANPAGGFFAVPAAPRWRWQRARRTLNWLGGTAAGAGMFIGHYGPAFGAKAALRRVPLWVYFLAVQWLDVWWSIFVLTGVEKVRIVPGFMQGSALDLYYMPYTHGLVGALALSAILGGIVALFFRSQRALVFAVVAVAVFSHWLLDLLVHAPDLWVYDDVKVGFGLWRWLWISLPLEFA